MKEKPKPICPVCGCDIDAAASNKDGVTYCCEPCAANRECDCGCCNKGVKQKR